MIVADDLRQGWYIPPSSREIVRDKPNPRVTTDFRRVDPQDDSTNARLGAVAPQESDRI